MQILLFFEKYNFDKHLFNKYEPICKMKLYRIILPVTNIEKASQFFANLIGQDGQRVSEGRHYFDLEGTILACYDPVADGDTISKPWVLHENQYIYIATDRLEEVHQRMVNDSEKEYVDKDIQLMPWGERLFYARDPFGNRICFVDRSTIFTG